MKIKNERTPLFVGVLYIWDKHMRNIQRILQIGKIDNFKSISFYDFPLLHVFPPVFLMLLIWMEWSPNIYFIL